MNRVHAPFKPECPVDFNLRLGISPISFLEPHGARYFGKILEKEWGNAFGVTGSRIWLRGNSCGKGANLMIKVEAIIKPQKWEEVKEALHEIGVEGLTVTEVRGHGRQKGHTETYRGVEYKVDLIAKFKVETVIKEEKLEQVLDAISKAAHTGQAGDGKVFVIPIQEVLRIRTGERGEAGL